MKTQKIETRIMRTRENIFKKLRNLYDPSEEVEHLVDWIRDTWETHDLLTQQFGTVYAFHISNAPSPLHHWFSLNTGCSQIDTSIPCSQFHQVSVKETGTFFLPKILNVQSCRYREGAN